MSWKLPFGASVEPDGIRYRLWAPKATQVAVVVDVMGSCTTHAMQRGTGGYHHAFVPNASSGARYHFLVDGTFTPDPASRSQPDGVNGLSEAIDPDAFVWSDDAWGGISADDLVIYEMHIGTFTAAGTFDAATEHIDDLVALGVTAVELMPVASFAGARNWGYDGVAWFAPSATYGGPLGLKRFVDAAHQRGLAVLLDVVYNHFGPEGNYLPVITGGQIFNPKEQTAWGDAINYDGENSAAVRDFVLQNALYWAHEFHIDGLRIDAVHAMIDQSPVHILKELASALHDLEPRRLIIAEDDRNERGLVLPAESGGFGLDAVWADDQHHQLRRLAAGDNESYFRSFSGTVKDVVATLRQGWFFEGQWSEHHDGPRGTPAGDLPPRVFVHCIQNHDQVGNRALGDRLHHVIPDAVYRAVSAVLLLSPYTPLLWMGQEWAASTPFRFFTDFPGALGTLVTTNRRREFDAFAVFRDPLGQQAIPDPQAESTFVDSQLRWDERARHPHDQTLALYAELLELRRASPAFRCRDRGSFHLEQLSDDTFAMRRESETESALALFQFADGVHRLAAGHELLALPPGQQWQVALSTNEARFGGSARSNGLTESGSVEITGIGALVLSTSRTSLH